MSGRVVRAACDAVLVHSAHQQTSVLSRLVIVLGGWVGAFTALRKVAVGVSEALVLRGGRSGASVRAVGSGAEPTWPGGLTV